MRTENVPGPATPLHRAEDVVFARAGDEVVIMSMVTDKYYGLDPIASRVWDLLAQTTSLDAICAALDDEYEVDRATCERDVAELLQGLVEQKLVHAVEA